MISIWSSSFNDKHSYKLIEFNNIQNIVDLDLPGYQSHMLNEIAISSSPILSLPTYGELFYCYPLLIWYMVIWYLVLVLKSQSNSDNKVCNHFIITGSIVACKIIILTNLISYGLARIELLVKSVLAFLIDYLINEQALCVEKI